MVSKSKKRKLRLCSFVYEGSMRDRIERFAVLPFGIGCVSQSSVAIGPSDDQPTREPKGSSAAGSDDGLRREDDRKKKGAKMKSNFRFLTFRKTHRSSGMQRLIRSIKSFSQIFVYKEEEEEETEEKEMEIGLPTDVKHVTHIGLDGSNTTTTTNPLKGNWENFNAPSISFPSISLKQFELAMAAQTASQPQQLLVDLKTPKDLD